MNWNPIKRSPLRPQAREHKESMPWRRKKVRLNGREMAQLRQEILQRSHYQCENSIEGERCTEIINWGDFHLAHIVSRGRGGSDSMDNVLACCRDCHFEDTRNRRKLQPHADWIAAA